jgi:hypothetical protein
MAQFCKVPATDYFLGEFTSSSGSEKPRPVVKVYEAIHAVKKDAAEYKVGARFEMSIQITVLFLVPRT